MTISKRIFAISTAAILAVGMMVAQTPPAGPQGGPGGPRGERGMNFLTTALDLTDAQQQQAKAIFDAAKTQSEPIQTQLKANHDAVTAAIKANQSDQQLQQLATAQGTLMGQLAAIHIKSMASFYQILTPEQKTKFDALHQNMRSFGGGPAGGRRPRG